MANKMQGKMHDRSMVSGGGRYVSDWTFTCSVERCMEKACTLGNRITTMQNADNGMIPTHWTRKECIEDGGQLWINCMIYVAEVMLELAEATEQNETEVLENKG